MNWPDSGPAQIRKNGHRFYVFNDVSYHESLVCYIESSLNILKLNFLRIPASELDETFLNNPGMDSPKMMKNDEKSRFF